MRKVPMTTRTEEGASIQPAGATSVIDRILNAIDEVATDYGKWSAWGSRMSGREDRSGGLHHQWNAESEIAARAILQYRKDGGMAVKEFPYTPPDSIWIHIMNRKCGKEDAPGSPA
jgi:hypothetical protein